MKGLIILFFMLCWVHHTPLYKDIYSTRSNTWVATSKSWQINLIKQRSFDQEPLRILTDLLCTDRWGKENQLQTGKQESIPSLFLNKYLISWTLMGIDQCPHALFNRFTDCDHCSDQHTLKPLNIKTHCEFYSLKLSAFLMCFFSDGMIRLLKQAK